MLITLLALLLLIPSLLWLVFVSLMLVVHQGCTWVSVLTLFFDVVASWMMLSPVVG